MGGFLTVITLFRFIAQVGGSCQNTKPANITRSSSGGGCVVFQHKSGDNCNAFRNRLVGDADKSNISSIEDLLTQARMIRHDVIGLAETRRCHVFNAVYDTGEQLFLGTCSSRGVGGVAVLVNTSLSMNIDSFEQLTIRIGRLRLKRCGSTPALTIFVVNAPTSNYDEEEDAFYIDLERFYREDHTFFKVITGDFNAKIGPRRASEKRHIGTHGVDWNEQDAVVNNIDEEYDRLIEHLHVSAIKAKSSKVTKKRLSPKTFELIRQRGIARAAGNRELASERAKQCRQAIKEDLKERKAAVMFEAAEARKNIRKARRSFANYKTKMIALRRPDGKITASRKSRKNNADSSRDDLTGWKLLGDLKNPLTAEMTTLDALSSQPGVTISSLLVEVNEVT
uniref:Endo/exonuclease/phosphatase domain-containing protein n=1 Tax=Angiostrongylus cantonensis TaxID=6313 RepID=A0A0K0DM47_ANGCA